MTNLILNAEMTAARQVAFADFAGNFATSIHDLRVGAAAVVEGQMGPGLLANDSWWQSEKIDISGGTGVIADEYGVRAAIPFATPATAGQTVDVYWNGSQLATVGSANVGGAQGADEAYIGLNANPADSAKQLQFIGSFVATADNGIFNAEVGDVGVFRPKLLYGSLVIHNAAGSAFGPDVETQFVLDPILPQIQDAA